jgi:hypothetical protein
MDKKTVFVKTDKGESEVAGRSDALFGDVKRILNLVDDESTVAEISKRAPPSLRDALQNMLQELDDGGYIRDIRAPAHVPEKPALKMSTPAFKMATPNAPPMSMPDMMMPTMPPPTPAKEEPAKASSKSELDFSFLSGGASPSQSVDQAAKERAAQDKAAQDKAQAEAQLKSKQVAEQQADLQEAAAKAAKLKAYEEAKVRAKIKVEAKIKFEAEAKSRIEAEARAKNAAEAARLKAEQDAQKSRAELEAAKVKMESEMRARIEGEARAKQEIEAVRLKAEKDAEKVRLELEAIKAKAEVEMRSRIEAEARAKAEMEARVKREAEAAKLKLEKERAELEAAKAKAEAEVKSRLEAELRIKAEVEALMQQEAAAEKLKQEKEREELKKAQAKVEAEVKQRLELEAKLKEEAEAELKQRAEAEVRIRAEVEARLKAEELAKSTPVQAASVSAPASPVKEVYVDPAEKLRQLFVESFGQQAKAKQDPASTSGFKLDNFSLLNTGKMPAATLAHTKSEAPTIGGSKVKAALDQRSQKENDDNRLKAEQEAKRRKAEQEEAARLQAEKEAFRLAAEREAYRLKAEQEEAAAKAEAEAQKLASQQSRQWEEAQQRAETHAQAEQERLARQSAEAQIMSQKKSTKGPRKPLPLGKILAGIFVLALVSVLALPYVLPLDEYIAPLEQEISTQVKQPVKIQNIHVAILPMPRLEIDSLAVGAGKELSVKSIVVNFDFSALFASTKLINKLELNDVTVTGAALEKSLNWFKTVGGSEQYPVTRMEFKGVRVNSADVKLPALNGKADFDPQGKFIKAELKSEDEKFALELEPLQNNLQLALNIRESSLPIFTSTKFNDFSATGVIENGEFIISDIFAHIYGGTLTGKGKLGWFNGWKLDVLLKAKSFELQSLFSNYGVTGQIYGDANVSMFAPVLSQLDKDPRMEGSFEAKDGVINKLDIDTIARFGTRQGAGGRTTYTELNGTVKADNRGQRFYLSKIAAGSVNGSGLFEIDSNQQLTGRLLVDVKGGTRGAVTMQLSGTPMEPTLQLGR